MLSRQVEVQFMCRVAVHECGNFYSIVWYEVTLSVFCDMFALYHILDIVLFGQVPGDGQQGGPGWAGEGVCVQTPLGGRQGRGQSPY